MSADRIQLLIVSFIQSSCQRPLGSLGVVGEGCPSSHVMSWSESLGDSLQHKSHTKNALN